MAFLFEMLPTIKATDTALATTSPQWFSHQSASRTRNWESHTYEWAPQVHHRRLMVHLSSFLLNTSQVWLMKLFTFFPSHSAGEMGAKLRVTVWMDTQPWHFWRVRELSVLSSQMQVMISLTRHPTNTSPPESRARVLHGVWLNTVWNKIQWVWASYLFNSF